MTEFIVTLAIELAFSSLLSLIKLMINSTAHDVHIHLGFYISCLYPYVDYLKHMHYGFRLSVTYLMRMLGS